MSGYRIVFREEGTMVNAYFAKRDTMDGAVLVLSARRTLIELHPPLYDALKVIVARMVERGFSQPGAGAKSFGALVSGLEPKPDNLQLPL